MIVEPISDEDLVTAKSSTESYISDLENEIDELQRDIKALKIKLKAEQQLDNSCCKAYKIIVKNFHGLLDDIIPF